MIAHPQRANRLPQDKSGSLMGWPIGFLILCAIGTGFSADLLRLHVKVYTDPNYHAFCAVSEHLNCETVAASSYSVFAGLPMALWGIVAYLFMGGLCLWGIVRRKQMRHTWPFGFLFWLSLVAVLVSAVLFFISHQEIQSLCLLCIATYVINLLLFGLTILELIRLKLGPFKTFRMDLNALSGRWRPFESYLASFLVLLVVVQIALPAYWEVKITTGPGGLLIGRTADGSEWIGARQPVLQIDEFSDYQCPHCSRGHVKVRTLVSQHPDRIRLVHRHYPLRRNRYSFTYSVMAQCAGQQARFWEANDYLYEHGLRTNPVSHAELAEAIGIDPEKLLACMKTDESQSAVAKDIAAGRALRLRGTPSYVIDGELYPGSIPENIIADKLDAKPTD